MQFRGSACKVFIYRDLLTPFFLRADVKQAISYEKVWSKENKTGVREAMRVSNLLHFLTNY
jgi:hypothetical protein